MSTTEHTTMKPAEVLERLHRDGHVVIEDVISQETVDDLHDRVDAILERERANPVDPATAK